MVHWHGCRLMTAEAVSSLQTQLSMTTVTVKHINIEQRLKSTGISLCYHLHKLVAS